MYLQHYVHACTLPTAATGQSQLTATGTVTQVEGYIFFTGIVISDF